VAGTRRRRERGAAMLTALVALVALLAMASLAIDGGAMWTARSQMQNSVDSAALAAAANMIDVDAVATTLPAGRAAALARGGAHDAVSTDSISVQPADVIFGNWDMAARTFDPGVDQSDPYLVNSVDVTARLDDVDNDRVPAFLSRVIGRTGFTASASATAYLGFAGSVAPGYIELPVAIDCCKLKGPNCEQPYCPAAETNPPNPCALEDPQDEGATTVSCLEFHSTSEQNACWTAFDGDSASINTPNLTDIVNNGNPDDVSTSEPVYVDNGTKTPVIKDIKDRMMGDGAFAGDPHGEDRYLPKDGVQDSWVVGLPVVECQTGINCAGGSPMDIVGFVCFEIREITVTPDKIIRGRFLCETDPLFEICDVGTTVTGGLDFGIRADIPVLVR
jgi:Flp pilus assembly protein TadG